MTKTTQDRIIEYGKQVDILSDSKEYEKLYNLLSEMKLFSESDEEAENDSGLLYFLGTGYSTYSDYLLLSGKSNMDPEVIEFRRWSMYYYRRAYSLYDQSNYADRLDLRILTNYANELDSVGRVIEAIRIYRIVLESNDKFTLARGNYGRALQFFANIVNDENHQINLHCYAYQAMKKAIITEDIEKYDAAQNYFLKIVNDYESSALKDIISHPIEYKDYPLGNIEEQKYRIWCLSNHLFLNPLNEVIELENAFAHDPLTIISFTEDINNYDSISKNPGEPPRWFAMLNQLKEEYIYARYLCYEGINKFREVHFADKEVSISIASYDYCNYSIRIEQLKSAYRILYSMLDQICFFINDFWKIGLVERKADAYNICKSVDYPKDNVALTGLYWVLCEFFEKYGDSEKASEKNLAILRHALEHKFVKIHEYGWKRELKIESDSFYHISEDDLKEYTLRLLEITREAVMYIIYAIGIDEAKKDKNDNTIPMMLGNYFDEWKR